MSASGELRHDHLKADLNIGDIRAELIGLAQCERMFIRHALGMPDDGCLTVRIAGLGMEERLPAEALITPPKHRFSPAPILPRSDGARGSSVGDQPIASSAITRLRPPLLAS